MPLKHEWLKMLELRPSRTSTMLMLICLAAEGLGIFLFAEDIRKPETVSGIIEENLFEYRLSAVSPVEIGFLPADAFQLVYIRKQTDRNREPSHVIACQRRTRERPGLLHL